MKAEDRPETPSEDSAAPRGDGGHGIPLRSALAGKIADRIHVEGEQIPSMPGLALCRQAALTRCYSAA